MKERWLEIFDRKKHVSDKISLNYDAAIKYDFYSVKIAMENGDLYLFQGYSNGRINALKLDGDSFCVHCELDPSTLKSDNFKIRHYYKANEYDYNSLKELRFTNSLDKIKTVLSNSHRSYTQYAFNKQKLIIKGRMEILSVFLNNYFDEGSQRGISSILLMSKLYSNKWLFHPERKELMVRIKFYLDSLVASGDLRLEHIGTYHITPKALETLEKYMQDTLKEQHNRKNKSWTLFWSILAVFFTLFSAWGTLVQAGILPKWQL